jgi:putative transposase
VALVGPRKLGNGHGVNEKRVRRLMRLMRLMPICQKHNTSRPAKGHKTYPYLLRGLRVDRPNQVWCVDITYLAMRRGARHGLGPVAAHASLYMVAIMDWDTRMVLSWRISNTLDTDFCVEALNEAIYRFGPPDIMNMEHGRAIGPSGHATSGSQFTSSAHSDRLRRYGIHISMDGKGRYLDNIFIERLWRTLNRRTAQRNTSASIYMPGMPGNRPAGVCGHGWTSTVTAGRTRPLAANSRQWSTH